MFKVMIAVLVFTVVTLIILLSIDPNLNGNSLLTQSSSATTFTVSISGQIMRPGTYVLNPDARLDDLIEAAGGTTENADDKAYLPECELLDAMSYYIAPKFADDDICGDYPYEKVGLNSSTKEDFLTISGIGTTISAAIVGYREEHGAYRYLEQVKEVSGIGNATFEKIKNYLTLE